MPSFKLTAKAKADLKQIAKYTERQWGKEQRNSYLLEFDECFHLLANNSDMGEACDFIRPGYRKFPLGSHLIFYKISKDGLVEIIRILHKRMDVDYRFK